MSGPIPVQIGRRVHDVHAGDLDALAAAATALSRWLTAPPSAQTLAGLAEHVADWPLPARGATAAGLALLAESVGAPAVLPDVVVSGVGAVSVPDTVSGPDTVSATGSASAAGSAPASGGATAASQPGDTTDDIAVDHARLFVGPGHLLAAPYESVHLSYEGLLFDEQTLRVRDWYRRYGLAAPRQSKEPDDHIGLELEFLAQLLAWALEAIDDEAADDAAHFASAALTFADEHVSQWAPDLFGLIRTHARTAFYRAVADLGDGLLAEFDTTLRPR